MGKMEIACLEVGMVGTNCYLAKNKETEEILIIDPGDEASRIMDRIRIIGGTPKAILLTHGHFDHVMAAEALAKEYKIPRIIYEEEKRVLAEPRLNACGMIGRHETYEADETVKDGQVLELAGFKIKVLFTPGHTPGGCCFYFEEENTLFSGDTLFESSVGRTDFPEGSMSQLIRSIRDKLLSLPEETKVYPGHMGLTTIGREKIQNPFL